MLRNFGTVRPIFPKIAPKVAQDLKEKSYESSWRGKKFPQNYRAKRRGGADSAPPALLGLKQKKIDQVCLYSYVFYWFMKFLCILLVYEILMYFIVFLFLCILLFYDFRCLRSSFGSISS